MIVATGGTQAASVTKEATTTIPVVFAVGEDPVKLGLVTSLARPGGNVTGVNYLIWELLAKRIALLHELLPTVTRVAALVNPVTAARSDAALNDVETAARAIGIDIQFVNASTSHEINTAFGILARDESRHFLYSLIHSLWLGECNSPPWQHAMRYRHHLQSVTMSKPVG